MAVVNLIFKPFSAILIFQMYRDRGGEYNINFGKLFFCRYYSNQFPGIFLDTSTTLLTRSFDAVV